MKNIKFVNWHQNGDIYLTRGLLRWIACHTKGTIDLWMGHAKGDKIYLGDDIRYFHGSNKNFDGIVVIDEFPSYTASGIQHTQERMLVQDFGQVLRFLPDVEELIINLWIAASPSYTGGFSGINSETLHKQAIEVISIINQCFNTTIPFPSEEEILARVPEYIRNVESADNFLQMISKYKKKVLLCNGMVTSGQTEQFSMSDAITELVINNPECAFIYTATDRTPVADNEYFINEYITDMPNLDEIVYVSTKCDIIVHRMSGPGIAASIYENFMDDSKTFISFTRDSNFKNLYTKGRCKYDWSDDHSPFSISSMIEKHL